MSNLKNTFKDNPKRASEAGKKSKRGPSRKRSIQKAIEQLYNGDIDKILGELEGKQVFNGKTLNECLTIALIAKALSGDVQAQKEINDKVDGKERQQLEIDATVKEIDLTGLTKKQIRQMADEYLNDK